MQRTLATVRVAMLALFTLLSLSCSGGGPTDPRTGNQLNLGIEFRPVAATQTSPIIPLTVELAPTGSDSSAQVFVRMVFKRPAQSSEYIKMTAAPGARNLNATGVTVTVPPGGTTIEFLWDALADLGPAALDELVILRAGVLNADASDPREAQCTIEPTIEVTFSEQRAECGLAPKLDGGSLPDAFRGTEYDETVPLRDGLQAPLRWERLDPSTGSALGTDVGFGLTLDPATGRISGLVNENAPATLSLLLRVSDSCSDVRNGEARAAEQLVAENFDQFDQEFFTIRFLDPGDVPCDEPAPTLTIDSLPTGALGQPYDFQTPATGGTNGLNFSATGLPPGLSMSAAGQITGTPTEIGSFEVSITVSDNCPEARSDSDTTTLVIIDPNACAPLTANPISPPVGDVGVPYSLTATAVGGSGTLTFSATGLPPGLSMSPEGTISGTPTADGSFPITVQVSDECASPAPQTASVDGVIIINPAPCPGAPVFSNVVCQGAPEPCDLPDAFLGAAYNTVVTVNVPAGGGTGQVVPGGNFPTGITVSVENNGTSVDFTVEGIPTEADDVGQTFTFSMSVTDACPTGPQTSTRSFRLFVDETLNPCPEPRAQILANGDPDTLPDGVADAPYSVTLDVSGGTLPVGAISITETDFPGAISIDDDGRTLLATPTTAEIGSWLVTLAVSDACSTAPRTSTQPFTLTIAAGCGPTPTITTPLDLPDATQGLPYSQVLAVADAVGAVTWQVVLGALPTGIVLATDGTLSGTTTDPVGTYSFTATVADSCPAGPRTALGAFTLDVVGPACGAPPVITTKGLPAATNGELYSFQLENSGDDPPFVWDIDGPNVLPIGLALGVDGLITGIPNDKPGDYTIPIIVFDTCVEGERDDTAEFTLTLNDGPCAPLSLRADPLPNAQFGVPYTASIDILGGVTPFTVQVTTGDMPSGLIIDSNGAISGTPDNEKDQGGSFPFTVTVTDSCGNPEPQTDTIDLVINVDPGACPPLVFDPQELADADFGIAYSQQLTVGGGVGPFSFTILPPSLLPSGLTLEEGGLITGTPDDEGEAGRTFNFGVRVTDSCANPEPQTASQNFSITITPIVTPCTPLSITTETLPNATNGQLYSQQLEALGGEGTLTWELDVKSLLPDGLSLSTSGVIGGVPQTSPGSYDFVVNLTDECDNPEPQTTSALLTILVIDGPCTPVGFSTLALPDALLDEPYSALLEASGGAAPYSFELGVEQFLPPGLAMDTLGLITGTVTDPKLLGNTFNFDITVTDSCTNPGPQTDTRTFQITIDAAPCDELILSSALPFTVALGDPVDILLPFSGGEGTLFWELVSGGLPAGVQLTQEGRLQGSIDDDTGRYDFTVQATDQCIFEPQVVQQSYTIIVTDPACGPVSITNESLADATLAEAYSQQLNVSGGVPPLRFNLSAGTLPSGLEIEALTGEVFGTPDNPSDVGLPFTFTVRVVDSCTGTGGPVEDFAEFTITVNPPICDPLAILTEGLPDATVGEPYSFQLEASGGVPPQVWLQGLGTNLPFGLGLDSTGLLSGTPAGLPGLYTLVATVTDNCALPQQDTATFPLVLNPASCPVLDITTTTLPDAVNGQFYSETFEATGGFGRLSWSFGAKTSVPAGLSLNTDGTLSGVPLDEPATYTMEVVVTDECDPQQSDTQFVALTLVDACVPVAITTEALGSPIFGSLYSAFVETSGGTGQLTFSITSGELPTGLDLSSLTGEISGTADDPTDVGIPFDFTVTVTDECPTDPTSDEANFRLVVQPPDCTDIFITTTGLPPATVDQSYGFQLDALGGQGTLTWSEGPTSQMPEGLTLNGSGFLSGIPTDTPGVYDLEIVVTDECAIPQSATTILPLVLNGVLCPTLGVSTESLPSPTFQQPYSTLIETFGGVPPLRFLLSDSVLPSGLTLNEATGEISGTPDDVTEIGVLFDITVDISDSCDNPEPQFVSVGYRLVVQAPFCPELGITTLALPPATQGQAYFAQLESSGGFPPVIWLEGLGSEMPEGLVLNSDGTITGTTFDLPGDYDINVVATDNCPSDPQTATASLVLTILPACETLRITSSTELPTGTQGQQYDFQFEASGGAGALTWSIPIGAGAPPGLTLQSDGLLTGIPTATGAFEFPVQVVDECPLGQQSAQGLFSVFFVAAPCAPPEITTESPLPNGEVATDYSFQFSATGGTGLLTWAIPPGPSGPPPGLSLNAAGVLSGVPLVEGVFTFPVRVSDSCPLAPQSDTETFTITIDPQACPELFITTEALPNATMGEPYSFFLEASGGVEPYTWSPGAGTQAPEGMDMSAGGEIFGTPGEFGQFSVFAVVNDNCVPPQEDVRGYLFTINPPVCAPLSITTASLPVGQVGQPYSTQLDSSGGVAPIHWTVSGQTPLPVGLSLSDGGLLSGTPEGSGERDVLFIATDECPSDPQQATRALLLSINDIPCPVLTISTPSPLPDGTVGEPYSFQMEANGGFGLLTWFLIQTQLPDGLLLSPDGLISGIPTTNEERLVEIGVFDECPSGQQSDSANYFITIQPGACAPAPNITTTRLPIAYNGLAYSFQMTAEGGEGSLIWVEGPGSNLPPVISLDSAGKLSGPVDSGTGLFTLNAIVRDNCDPAQTDSQIYLLEVRNFGQCNPIEVEPDFIPNPAFQQLYNQQLVAQGATGGVVWDLFDGSLPIGLSLSATGVLSGVPTSPDQIGQTFIFTARVIDSCTAGPQIHGYQQYFITLLDP